MQESDNQNQTEVVLLLMIYKAVGDAKSNTQGGSGLVDTVALCPSTC
jgi:hypothetical protein